MKDARREQALEIAREYIRKAARGIYTGTYDATQVLAEIEFPDSHPDTVESDEEAVENESIKRAYEMNEDLRDRRLCFKDGALFGIAHARKSQAAEVAKMREEAVKAEQNRICGILNRALDDHQHLTNGPGGIFDLILTQPALKQTPAEAGEDE